MIYIHVYTLYIWLYICIVSLQQIISILLLLAINIVMKSVTCHGSDDCDNDQTSFHDTKQPQ